MRTTYQKLIMLTAVFVSPRAFSDCAEPIPRDLAANAAATISFVERSFGSNTYECGILAARRWSIDRSGRTDEKTVDQEFELRNFALSVAQKSDVPSEHRVALLRAVTLISWDQANNSASVDKRTFHTLLALKAGKAFKSEEDFVALSATQLLAVEIDGYQPYEKKLIDTFEFYPVANEGNVNSQNIDNYISMARITKGNVKGASLRQRIVWRFYYQLSAPDRSGGVDVIADRCGKIESLTNALDDVQGSNNVPAGWQWRPTMVAATCYYNIARLEAARDLINKSINIIRRIENIDSRLGQYRFLMTDLTGIKYDKDVVMALIDEVRSLANTRDSQMAKEVRDTIPLIIKNRLNY